MRTNKELIELAIEHFDLFESRSCNGLCNLTSEMFGSGIITEYEESSLDSLIYRYKPKYLIDNYYFYPRYESAPRLKLLQTILKDLENETTK